MILNTKRHFWVAYLTLAGELHSKADYTYEDLEQLPCAADMIASFSAAIWKSPEVVDLEPILPARAHFLPVAGLLRDGGHSFISLLWPGGFFDLLASPAKIVRRTESRWPFFNSIFCRNFTTLGMSRRLIWWP